MMKLSNVHFLVGTLFILGCSASFNKEIQQHRVAYKEKFLETPHSPLKEKDLAGVRFFEPNQTFQVEATVDLVSGAKPFDMPTYAGTTQPYIKYAVAHFQVDGRPCTLSIYRNLTMARIPQYRDALFLPFKDHTNGETTYGGGRYLDLRIADLKGDKIIIDFNKAYNPYCAYSDNYQCPIPPNENQLDLAIKAGEKEFKG